MSLYINLVLYCNVEDITRGFIRGKLPRRGRLGTQKKTTRNLSHDSNGAQI